MPDTNIAASPAAAADDGPRQAIIRDLYALAELYSARPELPVPAGISIQHNVDDRAGIARIAEALDQDVRGDGDIVHYELPRTRITLWFITDEVRS